MCTGHSDSHRGVQSSLCSDRTKQKYFSQALVTDLWGVKVLCFTLHLRALDSYSMGLHIQHTKLRGMCSLTHLIGQSTTLLDDLTLQQMLSQVKLFCRVPSALAPQGLIQINEGGKCFCHTGLKSVWTRPWLQRIRLLQIHQFCSQAWPLSFSCSRLRWLYLTVYLCVRS